MREYVKKLGSLNLLVIPVARIGLLAERLRALPDFRVDAGRKLRPSDAGHRMFSLVVDHRACRRPTLHAVLRDQARGAILSRIVHVDAIDE